MRSIVSRRFFSWFGLLALFGMLMSLQTGCNCGPKPPPPLEVPTTDAGETTSERKCPEVLTPCNNDEECQQCGGSLVCIAGQCSEAPERQPDTTKPDEAKPDDIEPGDETKTCPTLCSSHDDCAAKACGERTECVNGVCSFPPRACPAECKEDKECQTPSCRSRIRCVQGKCSDLPACPSECTDDEECKTPACGPKNKCLEGTCKEPPKNDPPTAVALKSQQVKVGDLVNLDGSQSSDPDGDKLTYSWTFNNKPAGSQTAFNDAMAEKPSFIPDRAGTYEIQLLVNDGNLDSKPSVVRIVATAASAPTLTSLSPAQAPAGSGSIPLKAFGTNFDAGSRVHLDGKAVATTYINSTELSATLPAGLAAKSYAITVVSGSGTKSNPLPFVVTPTNDSPILTRLDPVEVKAGVAFTLKAFGDKFLQGAKVVIGTVNGIKTTFITTKELRVAVPALAAGGYTVYVKNPDGKVSAKLTIKAITVSTAPVLKSIAPTVGFAKQTFTLVLKGARFVTGAALFVGSAKFSTTFLSATELRANVNVSAIGKLVVYVQNPDSQKSNELSLEIKPALTKPVIQALAPNSVRELTAITIAVRGSDFVNGAKVTLDGVAYPTSFINGKEVRVTLPATLKAKSYSVVLTNPDNQKSNAVPLIVTPRPPGPIVTAVAPNRVAAGVVTELTVTGRNFVNGAQVQVGPGLYKATFASATSLKFTLPGSLKVGTYALFVFNPDGQKSNAVNITVYKLPPPVLTSITPNKSESGKALTVKLVGTGFANGARGIFQGGAQTTSFTSNKELQMTLSLGSLSPGTYSIWVQNPDGQVSGKLPFIITAVQGPQIKQLLPNKGSFGAKVNIIIDGAGFVTGAKVNMGTKTFTTSFLNAATLGATFDLTGVAAGTYPVTVVNPNGQKSNTVYFTVSAKKLPAPVLISVNPTKLSLKKSPPIYLLGKNFQNGALLMLPLPFVGAVGLPANYINANTLVVTTQLPQIPFPFPAQTAQVYVRNPDKQNSNRKPLQVSP